MGGLWGVSSEMRTTDQNSPPPPAPGTRVGELLRDWRAARGVSQMALALDANVSARHLSYVETGRAQPSRPLLLRLTEALAMPLREQNTLLTAAGYAPIYRETGLTAPEMAGAKRAIEFIMKQQEPYPAVVLSRHWDILMSNQASKRIFGTILGGPTTESNVMRLFFDQAGLRPHVVNWDECAMDLIRHLQNDVAAAPSDEKARQLLSDILSYPGAPKPQHGPPFSAPSTALLTARYRVGDSELRLFTTITTFGTPHDVALEELRIECSFPADDATDQFCREIAARR